MADSDVRPLKRIVVVGGGLMAAVAAVTLARFLMPGPTRVTWVRPRSGDEVLGGIEVVDPALGRWLAMVGVEETPLLQACHGLYSYGTDYQVDDKRFFVPYGTHGIRPSPAPFEQEFFKRFRGNEQSAFADHFLATQAARRARFEFPVEDPRSAKSTLSYGLHLDREALLLALNDRALALGVERLDCDELRVAGNPQAGIEGLRLETGVEVEGDFYVDATGDEALLMGQALNVEFEKAAPSLWPFRLTYRDSAETPWQPKAMLSREPWGWCRRAGLQNRRVVDNWVRDLSSLQTLEAFLANDQKEWQRETLWEGARTQGWAHNCLALGRADAQPGELVLSEWFWTSRCLLLWLELLPGQSLCPHLRSEYNRRRRSLYEVLHELHWLHVGPEPEGSLVCPEATRWRLSVFQSLGRLWRRDDDVLSDEAWICLALGLGWQPSGYDITLAEVDTQQLARKHATIHRALAKTVDAMPTLETFIKSLGRSRAQ